MGAPVKREDWEAYVRSGEADDAYKDWAVDEEYELWQEELYDRLTDDAVAYRRAEAEMAAQEMPIPNDNEIPF